MDSPQVFTDHGEALQFLKAELEAASKNNSFVRAVYFGCDMKFPEKTVVWHAYVRCGTKL